jgi:hypothetical protein
MMMTIMIIMLIDLCQSCGAAGRQWSHPRRAFAPPPLLLRRSRGPTSKPPSGVGPPTTEKPDSTLSASSLQVLGDHHGLLSNILCMEREETPVNPTS